MCQLWWIFHIKFFRLFPEIVDAVSQQSGKVEILRAKPQKKYGAGVHSDPTSQ
jgi:hypothetical protein